MSDHTRSLACTGLIVLVGVLTYASSLSGPFPGSTESERIVLTNFGIALQALERVDEARARFREALAISPNGREARRHLDPTAIR